MISEQARRSLAQFTRGKLTFQEPMKNHTSLHVGGCADAVVMPKDEADLRNLLRFVRDNCLPLTVIGNGTKLLVGDKGIEGITLMISQCLDEYVISGTEITAGAGRSLAQLSEKVAEHGLSGLEFAVGIPGTVGGAVVMNAGAHGYAMSDIVSEVKAMDLEGETHRLCSTDLEFGYRRSRLQDGEAIVLAAKINLKKDKHERIRAKMCSFKRWRKENQPLDFPNAGSIFKNPEGEIAGKLIETAGLKGATIGGAKISERRANFIVNLGSAKAIDVLNLIEKTRTEVKKKHKIDLEPEIRIVGKFS